MTTTQATTPKTAIFAFGWPPTVNTYWRPINRGGKAILVMSEAGREYRKHVALTVLLSFRQAKFTGRVAVCIDLHRPTNHRYDLDNMVKGIFDSLTHAGAWSDDSQVDLLTVRRISNPDSLPGCRVTITEFEAKS